VVNAEIRALFACPEVPLTPERSAEYRRLLAELRRVERGGVDTAA